MLRGKEVKFELQCGQIAELWEPCQELNYLERCHPHIPGGQVRGMCRAAKVMSQRVVGGVAVGAGRVRTGASGSNRIGAESGCLSKTEASVVQLGQLEGEWP